MGLVHGQKGWETIKWAWCMDRKDGRQYSGLGAWTERMGDNKVGLVHGQKGWGTIKWAWCMDRKDGGQ